MKFALHTDRLRDAPVDLVALGVFSDEPDRGLDFSQVNQALEGVLERICREESFKGEAGQIIVYHVPMAAKFRATRVVVVGLGPRGDLGVETLRRFAATVVRKAGSVSADKIALKLPVFEEGTPRETVLDSVQGLAEGASLGAYRFSDYQTKAGSFRPPSDIRIAFVAGDVRGIRGVDFRDALQRGEKISAAVAITRDLVNEPPNVLYPEAFSDRLKRFAKTWDLGFKSLGPRDLERSQMGLILGVGRGSQHAPRLCHLVYEPEEGAPDLPSLGLVGKGVTFDSGGLSLKTNDQMSTMKSDMGGAATVAGVMHAVSELKPKVTIHGIVALAENMPGGSALRPQDVLRSRRGLTVEVMNTDAEGRLLLADALQYAQEQKVDALVDVATLTGASMIALGRRLGGAFVRDEALAARLELAWRNSGETFWRLPLVSDYKKQLESSVADLKNVGERYGGAITAALFLEAFVDDAQPWAHLDIAGPVLQADDGAPFEKGATGFGVSTLVELIRLLEDR